MVFDTNMQHDSQHVACEREIEKLDRLLGIVRRERDELERLLRCVCANVVGTPIEKQSGEVVDIALAIESAFAEIE